LVEDWRPRICIRCIKICMDLHVNPDDILETPFSPHVTVRKHPTEAVLTCSTKSCRSVREILPSPKSDPKFHAPRQKLIYIIVVVIVCAFYSWCVVCPLLFV
jgi:hypothetical protein